MPRTFTRSPATRRPGDPATRRPGAATRRLNTLIDDCRHGHDAEVRGMGGTIKRWRDQTLAWHATASNGPTEGLNSIIKKIKRVAAGFRSFTNHRTRILLACGGCDWTLLGNPPR